MNVIVVKNYEEMSAKAAAIVGDVVRKKPNCVLGLATGDTPIGMYDGLVAQYEKGELDFSGVRSVNLDEYYPIAPENDQSYRYFMNLHLFDRVNMDKANTMVPDGTAKDPDAHCAAYEQKMDEMGGVDIQVLGIGKNGHIGFNEPDSTLYPYTHLTALTPNTIEANARFFASEEDVPKHALTMGMESIFKAKEILLLVSGAGKAEAVKKVLTGMIDPMCPASLLRLHSNVTMICDEAAYSLIQ